MLGLRFSNFAALAAGWAFIASPGQAQEVAFNQTPIGSLIVRDESGGRNVRNFRYDKKHTAGGICQITDTTWQRVAPTVDINIQKFPNAGSASEHAQYQVCWKLLATEGVWPWACCNAQLRSDLKELNVAMPAPIAPKPTLPPAPTNLLAHEWHEISANGVITSVSLRPHEWHEIMAANSPPPNNEDKHE